MLETRRRGEGRSLMTTDTTTLLKDRTRRSLKIGDRFAISRNPRNLGHTHHWSLGTFGAPIERWHTVSDISKRMEQPSGEIAYRVTCSSCGRVGILYEDALVDIRREIPPRVRRKYAKGTCQDCGRTRNVTTIYWWVNGNPYVVCAECIDAYRGSILDPCSPDCIHNRPRRSE